MTTLSDPTGEDWTPQEIDLVVSEYFSMLAMEMRGEHFVKLRHNEKLQAQTRRSKGSIEFKHQNISAVMERLGMPRIEGYKPMRNYQGALIESIERHLITHGEPRFQLPEFDTVGMEERSLLHLDLPPSIETIAEKDTDQVRRLVRKFDPAARDAKNSELGKRGEQYAFDNEVQSLMNADRFDLARKVKWVSQEIGDGLGYDIHSFDELGHDRLIEVKTTTGPKTTPFYISENELLVSQERMETFKLLRLYEFAQRPRGFELAPPLDNSVVLRPTNYRAEFETVRL